MGIADSISIHAPRTGSDGGCRRGGGSHHISIHAPRTGSDTALVTDKTLTLEFQSTLPARGATLQTAADFQDSRNFNPRSPHGERRGQRRESVPAHQISIHAPRTGSDNTPEERKRVQDAFQSTLPARGATSWYGYYYAIDDYFNPRSPHGERQGFRSA